MLFHVKQRFQRVARAGVRTRRLVCNVVRPWRSQLAVSQHTGESAFGGKIIYPETAPVDERAACNK
jgi:hypothetical protein